MPRTALISAMLLSCILTASSAAKSRGFVMPSPPPATAMPLHDVHPQEKFAAAADPYDTPQKASLFHPALLEHEVLPILVVFTNDGDRAILLSNARFKLVTRDDAKADPYTMDDLRRVLTSVRPPRSRGEDQMPIPLPGKNRAHGGLSSRDRIELQSAIFDASTVEPHSSARGFLFFDVSGLDRPAQGAHLYVTGVTDAQGRELMYFDVPLQSAPGQP